MESKESPTYYWAYKSSPVSTCSVSALCTASSYARPAGARARARAPAAADRVAQDIDSECSRRSPRSVEGTLGEKGLIKWRAKDLLLILAAYILLLLK